MYGSTYTTYMVGTTINERNLQYMNYAGGSVHGKQNTDPMMQGKVPSRFVSSRVNTRGCCRLGSRFTMDPHMSEKPQHVCAEPYIKPRRTLEPSGVCKPVKSSGVQRVQVHDGPAHVCKTITM